MLEHLEAIPPPKGELKSAFPIQRQWLVGELDPTSVVRRDLGADVKHLDKLWSSFLEQYGIRQLRTADPLLRRGYALVRQGRVMYRDTEEPGVWQPFRLQLRSQASGDATLLHCSSEVGAVGIEHDDDRLDELYELQIELNCAKVCVSPDPAHRTDRVSLEGDIVFHPDTAQFEELESLVTRTVGAAGVLVSRLVERQKDR